MIKNGVQKNHFGSNQIIILILIAALALRLVYSLFVFTPLLEKKGEELGWVIAGKLAIDPYDAIAKNILSGKGYVDDTNRFNFERLPLYTYFLVIVYKFFGYELWKTQVIQSILDTLSCFLIFLISLKTFQKKLPALLAAFFYAVYFKMINMVARPFSESLYILLLLLFLFFFIDSFKKTTYSFLSGIFLGLITITKPITLMFPIIAIGLYLYKNKKSSLGKISLFLVGFLILIMPIFIRNYLREGKIFFSTGGGKMLYMGTAIDYSKNFRDEEQKLIKEINEKYSFPYDIAEDNKLRKMAMNNIVNDPVDYMKRLACRVYYFWAYPDYSTTFMALKSITILVFNLTLIFFAIWGFTISKTRGVFYSPFLWIILYFFSVHVFVYAYSRYSLPLYPILFMFSSFALTHLLHKLFVYCKVRNLI